MFGGKRVGNGLDIVFFYGYSDVDVEGGGIRGDYDGFVWCG